jgi:hypothetical protein
MLITKWPALRSDKPASTQTNAHQLIRRGEAQRDGCLCALANCRLELHLTDQTQFAAGEALRNLRDKGLDMLDVT